MKSRTLVVALVGFTIIIAAVIVLLQLLGIINLEMEMLITILTVIIIFEIAVFILAFILRRKKKTPVQPQNYPPEPSATNYQDTPPQPASPELPTESETLPQEFIEYKVPGKIRSFGTEYDNKFVGIEIKNPAPSMKFGDEIFIIKRRIERVPVVKVVTKREPVVKELPKTREDLESVIQNLIEKNKKSKPKSKPRSNKPTVKKKHGRKK